VLAILAFTNRDYHFTGLVWAGSIINSMAPLLLGAAIGPFSGEIQLATALNTPYIFMPVAVVFALLSRTPPLHKKEGAGTRVRSHHLLADIVLLAYNFLIPIVHILRLMCVFDSQSPIAQYWAKVEPVFDRKSALDKNDQQDYAFMSAQAVQWAFWFIPWHWAALFEQIGRIRTGKRTVILGSLGVDLAALAFGGYLQSLACHIVTSHFDMRDGVVGLYVRQPGTSQEFWLVNISTIVCALLQFVNLHVQDVEDVKEKSG